MPAINITDRFEGIQYTGSNSAEIDATISNLTIVSETGGVLTVQSPSGGGSPHVLNTGDWARFTQGAIVSTHPDADFTSFYVRNAVFDDLDAVEAALDDVIHSAGVKECPLLIVGNTTVSVDIIPAMPDTSYTPYAQLFASVALLGSLSISSVTVVDTDTVDVVINNGGLISLTGANVLVTVTQ